MRNQKALCLKHSLYSGGGQDHTPKSLDKCRPPDPSAATSKTQQKGRSTTEKVLSTSSSAHCCPTSPSVKLARRLREKSNRQICELVRTLTIGASYHNGRRARFHLPSGRLNHHCPLIHPVWPKRGQVAACSSRPIETGVQQRCQLDSKGRSLYFRHTRETFEWKRTERCSGTVENQRISGARSLLTRQDARGFVLPLKSRSASTNI